MKFYLIVAKGKKQGMYIPIEIDLFLIGTSAHCQMRTQAHPTIGEEHCAFVIRDRKVFIRDMGSGHTTLVNDEPIPESEEWPLHAGDRIEVGPLKFLIQFREKALSQRDMEEWALKCLDSDSNRHITIMDQLDAVQEEWKKDSAAATAAALIDRMQAHKGIVKGRLRISKENGFIIVRLSDIYLVDEAELALIRRELNENLDRPNLRVILDLKNVRKMSTAGAELFGELEHYLSPRGGKLAMVRLRPEIESMLHSFPATKHVRFYKDKTVAMAAKW